MHPCIDYGRVGIALLAGYGLAFGETHWRDASALASYGFISFVLWWQAEDHHDHTTA